MTSNTAVGIDLGTTYSCVAVWDNGKIHIVLNSLGYKTTPSYVAYAGENRMVGHAAKNQMPRNIENTVYDAKRMIGRRFDDESVQNDSKHWLFNVVEGDGNVPNVKVKYQNDTLLLRPEEISSTILKYMKETAERYLRNITVTDVVVTVPAYFNSSQRQATKDAAAIAGLNVMEIITEPVAAALAYGLEHKIQGMQIVLIYDLGGGTFDVSIVKIINGKEFEVKAITGNNHLGGEDFDKLLVEHFAKEFERYHKLNLRDNANAMCKLRIACEKAKCELTSSTEASIDIDCLFQNIDFSSTIRRPRFEALCADLFKQTIVLVADALKDAECDKVMIDEVVMVGGSTRILKIQQMVSEFFDNKTLNNTINPDEAVAFGAAVHAAKLANVHNCEMQNVKVSNVVPISFSIRVVTGACVKIIEKNKKIPCKLTKLFYPSVDYGNSVLICVYEGEHEMASDNEMLGEFLLTDITYGLADDVPIDVTFSLNSESILTATATERRKNNSKEIEIDVKSSALKKDEINKMLIKAMQHAGIDDAARRKAAAKNDLIDYIEECELAIADDLVSRQLSNMDKEKIEQRCQVETKWLETNDGDESTFESHLRDFKKFIDTFDWNLNKNKLT